MNRKQIVLIMALTILVGLSNVAFNIQPVNASGTIYIRADGSIDPPTPLIATVDNVTYTFTGNIDGSIYVERDNIVVDGAGYTVNGSRTGSGIFLNERINVTMKNTKITGLYSGIRLHQSSNNTISANNVTNNEYGIVLYHSSSNILRNNSLFNNTNNFAVSGLWFVDDYINDVDTSNTVEGKPVYYWVNRQNMSVPSDAGYVILANCTGITVRDLNLTEDGEGALLAFTTNSTITKNNIRNRGVGIYLRYSSNNVICENSISGDITYRSYGINILSSSNNTVIGNNITANQWSGISLGSSNNNSIIGNNITANWDQGIILDDSSNNTISENNIANNYFGIELEDSSNNTLTGNNIVNNRNFLEVGYGIELWASSDNIIIVNNITHNDYGIRLHQSSNNTFYHNNFTDNTQQVYIEASGYPNAWDCGYPSGGNYWSDYTGIDLFSGPNQNITGNDGIGDTSYVIDADNRDRYPVAATVPVPPEIQVGVKAGDWIRVEYTITEAPSGTQLPQWLKVEFLSVVGTNATVRVTMHMSDGTEQNVTMPVDVVAGGQAFGLSGFVVPANLTTGDVIYMSGYGNVTIAGETTGTYAGASRTVVYASISQLTYYWDKQTGVLVEASGTSAGMTMTAQATETNMWEAAPGFPVDPIILSVLIAIVIVVVIAIFLVCRKKKPTEAQGPET